MSAPQELLLKAADHIQQYGHTKGAWADFDGAEDFTICPSCAGGALALAVSDGADFSPNALGVERKVNLELALDLLIAHLHLVPTTDSYVGKLEAVINWNDDPDREPEEIIETLRGAADA